MLFIRWYSKKDKIEITCSRAYHTLVERCNTVVVFAYLPTVPGTFRFSYKLKRDQTDTNSKSNPVKRIYVYIMY